MSPTAPEASHTRIVAYVERPTWLGDAEAAASAARDLLDQRPDPELTALAWATLARAETTSGRVAAAQHALDNAVTCLPERPRTRDGSLARLVVDNERGRRLAKAGRPGEAHAHFASAVRLARRLDVPMLLPVFLVNEGNTLTRLQDFGGALACYEESLALAGADGDHRTRGLAWHNLAVLYESLHDLPEAIACCVAANEAFGGERLAVLDTLALLLGAAKRHDEAVQAARDAVALSDLGASAEDQGRARTTLGSVLLEAERIDEAEGSYREAAALLQGSDFAHATLAATCGLASIALERADAAEALALLDGLFEEGSGVVEGRWHATVLRQRAQAHRMRGDLEAALDHIERAHSLEQEAVREESAARLRQLRVRHDVERARRETARLARAKRELEQQIEDRTLRLHEAIALGGQARLAREELEAQLLRAQRMEAIGLLAGGVAHDFNNVLTVILAYAELLEHTVSAANAPMVQDIKGATERGIRLTSRLLALTRGRAVTDAWVDVDDLVQDLTAMLSGVLASNLGLVARTAAPGRRVRLDPSHLEQVLLNLILNARDATTGAGTITVSTRPVLLEGPLGWSVEAVTIGVHDTGVGIAAPELERVFEPLYTTKEPGRGTGIGLSTVRAIVTRAGGEVRVQSTPGRGTTFEVELPIGPVLAVPRADSGVRVAVLATDPRVRAVVAGALTRGGHQVIPAEDAAHLLERLEASPSQVALVVAARDAAAADLASLGIEVPVLGLADPAAAFETPDALLDRIAARLAPPPAG